MEATREILMNIVWVCGIYSVGGLITVFLATFGMVRRNRNSAESDRALGTIIVMWPVSMVIYLVARVAYATKAYCTKRKSA